MDLLKFFRRRPQQSAKPKSVFLEPTVLPEPDPEELAWKERIRKNKAGYIAPAPERPYSPPKENEYVKDYNRKMQESAQRHSELEARFAPKPTEPSQNAQPIIGVGFRPSGERSNSSSGKQGVSFAPKLHIRRTRNGGVTFHTPSGKEY